MTARDRRTDDGTDTGTERIISTLELERAARMAERRADWRVGGIVYQAIVDRFAPSLRLDDKRALYDEPRRLRPWNEQPHRGHRIEELGLTEGQLEFWGGDLESLRARLDHLETLGVRCLYLNPIFEAFTNHKYDASDYFRVDPQYGTNAELRALADDLHARGMRLMLDGVFNHMGRHAPMFQRALAHPASREAEFFHIGEQFHHGWRGWRNGANLPELNVENPAVRAMLYDEPDSVLRHYLREADIDGWRLDVAPDLGLGVLEEITRAAHDEKPTSCIIGECWNYPADWLRVQDGILLMHVRELLLALARGRFSPAAFGRALGRLLAECPYEGLLRSHLVLDNHDTPRLMHEVPDAAMRRLLRVLQFTLPGCPTIYYGSEVGMDGGADPLCRGPMRWDLVNDANEELALVRRLAHLREKNAALVVGDCMVLDAERLVAFLRTTEHAVETLLVVANPSEETVTELVPVRHSLWMDAAPIECLLTGERMTLHSGTALVSLPPCGVHVFRSVDRGRGPNYSMFKRVL
jgi:glycosidase